MSHQRTDRRFLRNAAVVALCGGIALASLTGFIEAYNATHGAKSGHGNWSDMLSMLVRIPGGFFLTALRLDHFFAPTTRFAESTLFVVANGLCVATLVLAFAVFCVVCRRALAHDNHAA